MGEDWRIEPEYMQQGLRALGGNPDDDTGSMSWFKAPTEASLAAADLSALEAWCANRPETVEIDELVYTNPGTPDWDAGSGDRTLLWYALGRAEAVEILLRHGADVHHEDNQDLLHAAACFGSVDVATLLLDAGVSVEHVVPDEASSVWNPDRGVFEYYEGWTPLFEAVRSGQFDVVRLLLSRGADPERRDSKGYTAFRHGQRISGMSERPEYFEVARECTRCLELFVTVRVAGGYGRYVRAPRIQLLVLRVLCERGRARPPRRRRGGVLAGMFGETSPLPQECFWRICEYWRGIRDYGSAWPENVGSPSGPDIPGRREQRENRERRRERARQRGRRLGMST